MAPGSQSKRFRPLDAAAVVACLTVGYLTVGWVLASTVVRPRHAEPSGSSSPVASAVGGIPASAPVNSSDSESTDPANAGTAGVQPLQPRQPPTGDAAGAETPEDWFHRVSRPVLRTGRRGAELWSGAQWRSARRAVADAITSVAPPVPFVDEEEAARLRRSAALGEEPWNRAVFQVIGSTRSKEVVVGQDFAVEASVDDSVRYYMQMFPSGRSQADREHAESELRDLLAAFDRRSRDRFARLSRAVLVAAEPDAYEAPDVVAYYVAGDRVQLAFSDAARTVVEALAQADRRWAEFESAGAEICR